MGVETDYILATEKQAKDILKSMNPSKDYNGVYAKGSDPLSLSALVPILSGIDMEEDCIDQFVPVAVEADGEVSVVKVPMPIRNALSEFDLNKIEEYVQQWMETEDYMLCMWEAEVAKDFLIQMREMLNGDDANSKELYMWICV